MRDTRTLSDSYLTARGTRMTALAGTQRRRATLEIGAPRVIVERAFQLELVCQQKRSRPTA